jgi:hypothetical protein
MRKVILTVAAFGLAALMVTEAQAGPFGWFRRGRPVYVQPGPVATAEVQPGRTFSYEPAPTVAPAPAMRTYRTYRGGYTGKAYENAINKSLGRGF